VLWITSKDLLGLLLPAKRSARVFQRVRRYCGILVWPVDIVDCDDGKVTIVAEVTKRNPGTRLDLELVYGLLRHIEGDGHREEGAVCETAVGNNTGNSQLGAMSGTVKSYAPIVVLLVQEAYARHVSDGVRGGVSCVSESFPAGSAANGRGSPATKPNLLTYLPAARSLRSG
jgi:hypothetical protein